MSVLPKPSYWEADTFLAPCDVLIVGAGIVGTNAAIHLKSRSPSLEVCLIERETYPLGASTRNAGFACFGSLSELLSDFETMGEEQALRLVEKRKRGLDQLLATVGGETCDYRQSGGGEVFGADDRLVYESCHSMMDEINQKLKPVFGSVVFQNADNQLGENGLSGFEHMIGHPCEGQLHPAKMMRRLHEKAANCGVRMLFGLPVATIHHEAEHVFVQSTQGFRLQCKYLIVATNGFAKTLLDDIELTPARNQVIVTAQNPNLRLDGCFHYHEGFVYFRNVGKRLLIGGARHMSQTDEETHEFGLTDEIQTWLRTFAKDHILGGQEFKQEYSWSGIMGVGNVKQPIIRFCGQRIVAAVRLGGMGIAIGSLVGSEAADLIFERL